MEITFDYLMRFREVMTVSELERYGDYLAHREVEQPFTIEDIADLERRIKLRDMNRKIQQHRIASHWRGELEVTKTITS